METYESHRKSKLEADRPDEESLKLDYSEQPGGNEEQKYWLLFEDADEGVVVLQNEKFCFTNKKLTEITDYSYDDLASKKLSDFTHPDDRELVSNWYKRCLQGDKTNLTHPFRVITCSGEVKWVLGNSVKINWKGECAVMGFITDISFQNQTKETAADSMQLFKDFFEHSRIGAFSVNLNGDILYVNQVAADIFDYQSPEKMISGNLIQIGQNCENLDNVFDSLKTATTIKQCSLTIKTKTGHSKILRCDGILHNDQVWMLIPEADECSQKKIAYQREIEARETLVNALDDCALLIDLEGRIQTINKTAAEIMGGNPQELVGLNIFSAMPSGSAIFRKNQIKKAERMRKPVQFQAKFMDQHYLIRINPVTGKAGKINSMAIFAKNVTEQIQHDKSIIKAHTKLKCEFVEQKKDLKNKTRLLDETNIALSVLLKKRDEDKLDLEQRIMNAVKELVLPYVAKLDRKITDDKCKTYLGILEANLKSILSPFSEKLSSIYMRLTPSEIEVAEYIKYGKSSKEIAEMLNLSVKTIETYRAKIRKKTGLRNKKTNLRTYLLSFKSL